jgi:hypothetical protein
VSPATFLATLQGFFRGIPISAARVIGHAAQPSASAWYRHEM